LLDKGKQKDGGTRETVGLWEQEKIKKATLKKAALKNQRYPA
jgi:hypothetical protein